MDNKRIEALEEVARIGRAHSNPHQSSPFCAYCDKRWPCEPRRLVDLIVMALDPQIATADEWRAAYDAKVQDLARETARLSLLVQAVVADGHRADALTRHNRSCGVCEALRRVTGAGLPLDQDLGEE